MNHFEVILYSLAIAFCWVNLIRPKVAFDFNGADVFEMKPFNCLMCMTGWVALIIALFAGYGFMALFFLPVGVLVGAMFEGFTMRYL